MTKFSVEWVMYARDRNSKQGHKNKKKSADGQPTVLIFMMTIAYCSVF